MDVGIDNVFFQGYACRTPWKMRKMADGVHMMNYQAKKVRN